MVRLILVSCPVYPKAKTGRPPTPLDAMIDLSADARHQGAMKRQDASCVCRHVAMSPDKRKILSLNIHVAS